MPDTEQDITSAQIAMICRRAYPELDALRVEGLARISDGWECDVYRFDLFADEAGQPDLKPLILRVYLGRGAVHKAREEFRVLRSLRTASYPVPRVDAVLAEETPIGRPLTLMERIDGPILGRLLLDATDSADRNRHFELFCRLMVDLHRLDWRPFVPEPDSYHVEEAVPQWIARMRGLLASLNVSEFERACDWLQHHAGMVDPGRLSVVHWDFHPWNVLMRSNGDPAVIDWTSAGITDPRFDLAWTLLLVQAGSGTAARDAVLANYERLCGAAVANLDFFDAAASLRRMASMVVSLSAGSEVFGMRAGAEQQMRQNLTHLVTAYEIFRSRTGLRIAAVDEALA